MSEAERLCPARAVLAAVLVGALVVSCASNTDPIVRKPGHPAAVADALRRQREPANGPVNADGRALAFVVARRAQVGQERALDQGADYEHLVLAVDVSTRRSLWQAHAPVDGRIVVSRSVAVYSDVEGALHGLSLIDGRERWHYQPEPGAKLSGYASDEQGVFAVYRHETTAGPSGRLVTLEATSGKVIFRVPLADRVGAPAARGGLVAVPQRSQFVTLFDGRTGTVLADILSREEAAQFVHALPEGIFFGSQGVFMASSDTAQGSRRSPGYLRARLPAFVRPVYHFDGYQPAQLRYSAVDRNRLLWRVSVQDGRPAFADGLVVICSFRFLFGIGAQDGDLRWAYRHPRVDLASAALVGRSLVFVDTEGQIGVLETATGRPLSLGRIGGLAEGMRVEGATFDCEGYYAEEKGIGPASSLVEVLRDIVLDSDRRFLDVRIFAVDRLASLRAPEVTAALLDILDRGSEHEQVVQTAADALVNRQDAGALDIYARAIALRTDYADGTRAQRVDLMARALAKLGARALLPHLTAHVLLPETEPGVVRNIADAVLALEADEAVPVFRDYLSLYRADASMSERPIGLIASAEVLAVLGSPEDRVFLFFMAESDSTVAPLRTAVGRMLSESQRTPRRRP